MNGLLSKIKLAFGKTAEKISSVISAKKLKIEDIANIEEVLLQADFGISSAENILKHVKSKKPEDIKEFIKQYISEELSNFESDLLSRDFCETPYVILVIGVNGNGKTTTIAKLANLFKNRGLHPRVAACDTFRAAATEQLCKWSKAINCDITIGKTGDDPSGLAYYAYQESIKNNNNVLIVDTAGRLHNRNDLMDELLKIKRVLKKLNQNIPHETIVVLDSVTGQSAFSQIESFSKAIGIDSVILTKMDSSSKGGAIVGIAHEFKIPISAVCFGENINDIFEFSAEKYADSIFE